MKIRVLHCISDSNIGGAGRLLLHLFRHFDKDIFEVTAVVPKGSDLVPRIRDCGIPSWDDKWKYKCDFHV